MAATVPVCGAASAGQTLIWEARDWQIVAVRRLRS
jgi:hypothetical protein